MLNVNILKESVQAFLKENKSLNPSTIALQKSPFKEIHSSELAEQIKGMQIAQKKFPFLLKEVFHYPKSIHLEQSSSEKTALYKQQFVTEKDSFADVTGGMGIDFFHLASRCKSSIYVENFKELFEITKLNFENLVPNSSFINTSAEDFLEHNSKELDLIYIDPSRRIKQSKKFLIEDLEPNILELETKLLEKASTIIVKLSPMYDISEALKKLQFVSEIHLVAVKNELKELLLILQKETTENPKIVCCNITENNQIDLFNFQESTEINYAEPLQYLYIPNVAVLKSKKEDAWANTLGFSKLHSNTSIYTSDKLNTEHSGRSFEVVDFQPNTKQLKGEKLNLISKNHPLQPKDIVKKYKITEGGTEYLLAFQSFEKKFMVKARLVN